MSQNETTTVLVTDAKNLTLIDATRENSPWCIQGVDWQRVKWTAISLSKHMPNYKST